MSARCGSPRVAQLRNGGNSCTGNAFQGSIGFDYMGLSMDFLGGKIYDAISAGILSQAQLASAVPSSLVWAMALFLLPSPTTSSSASARNTRSGRGSSLAATSRSTSPTRIIRWAGCVPERRIYHRCREQHQLHRRQDSSDGVDRREILDHARPRHYWCVLSRMAEQFRHRR